MLVLGPPRHPSQLYEAVLEGLVLFAILWWMFWKTDARYQPGKLVGAFLFFYGIFRFGIEFIREPDSQLDRVHPGDPPAHGPVAVAADDPGRAVLDADSAEAPRAGRADRRLGECGLTPLERALRERIAAEGPITVEAYMEACNDYYYATRDPLGAAGDFTTAPEISQMFGEMIGAALADCWTRAGAPADAIYVELGPGRGTLASDALRVMRAAGFDGGSAFHRDQPGAARDPAASRTRTPSGTTASRACPKAGR